MTFRRLLCFFAAILAVSVSVNAATPPPRAQLQVLSYAIAVELDPSTHHLSAQAQLKCVSLADQGIAVFELHNDLRPSSITDGDNHTLTAERNTQDNTIRIQLPGIWAKGAQQTFTFKYDGVLNTPENSPVDGLKLAYVGDPISYLLYAGRWFPMVGYSTSRFAAAITVRVPQDYTAVGSGAQGGGKAIGGGKVEYNFVWDQLGFPGTIVVGKFSVHPGQRRARLHNGRA